LNDKLIQNEIIFKKQPFIVYCWRFGFDWSRPFRRRLQSKPKRQQ